MTSEPILDYVLPELVKTAGQARSFIKCPHTGVPCPSVYPSCGAQDPSRPLIQIWSAGCGTGLETYLLAILIREALGEHPHSPNISVIGTDPEEARIAAAREGVYAKEEVDQIGKVPLDRYFFRGGTDYRVNEAIGALVRFQTHSLLSGPPFGSVDLAICQNTLVRLAPSDQERASRSLYRALRWDGFLLLGEGEVLVGDTTRWLRPMDGEHLVYQKQRSLR